MVFDFNEIQVHVYSKKKKIMRLSQTTVLFNQWNDGVVQFSYHKKTGKHY